jgi:Recombination endonuclease VII
MLADQRGACLGCDKPDPERVDHDHETGRVRGMLCFNCNQALGNARDDIDVLERLRNYLVVRRPDLIRERGTHRRPLPELDLEASYAHSHSG